MLKKNTIFWIQFHLKQDLWGDLKRKKINTTTNMFILRELKRLKLLEKNQISLEIINRLISIRGGKLDTF